MKTRFALITILLIAAITGFAEGTANPLTLALNEQATVTTTGGLTLHSSFGGPDYFYAVLRVSGLKPGIKYEATITFDGGTDIGYAMSWVSGNPLTKTWGSLGGLGSGTGSGTPKPGYETKQIFIVDPESSEKAIYLVVRSNEPWEFKFVLSDKYSGVTRESKNKYGYVMLEDWTNDGKTKFLLNQKEEAPKQSL